MPRWTLAPCKMIIHCAKCLNSTLLKGTWILAFSLNTSLSQWAFIITFTTWFFTNCIWISNISNYTCAYGSMVSNFAFGVSATCCGLTWVLTFLSNACKVCRTFRIYRAFRSWSYMIEKYENRTLYLHRANAT